MGSWTIPYTGGTGSCGNGGGGGRGGNMYSDTGGITGVAGPVTVLSEDAE